MSEPGHLSALSTVFLFIVALGADGTKLALEFLFGIGLILDPFVISPVTAMIFWVVFTHNDMPMFSGRFASAGWTNLFVSVTPGVDAVPDWTVYTCYIVISDRMTSTLGSIMGG